MKNKLLIQSLTLLLWPLLSLHAEMNSDVRNTLRGVIEEAGQSMRQAGVPTDRTISVLPIVGDEDRFVEGVLKNEITRAGLSYVEGRDDPIFNEIMAEFEWDERREDMIDPTTIDRFGDLMSTQLLLYGIVREARSTERQIYVELEFHLTSIGTKEHLWGDVFVRRVYLPAAVTGIVDLNPEIRQLLQETFSREAESLRANNRLDGIETVVLAPIAGDIDGYIGTLAENLLSQSQVIPARADVATMGEIRRLLRDEPARGDAILSGAARDLSLILKETRPLERIYEVNAEVQLRIEEAATGNILWSNTLFARGDYSDRIGIWDFTLENALYIGVGIAIILFVFLILFFLIATRRSR